MTSFDEIYSKSKSYYQEIASGNKPWIRIGTAVCGEAAGSKEVVDRIKSDLSSLGIDANVSEVGCIGLCYAEPIVDVVKPGMPRIFYGNVNPDIASEIVKSYVSEDDYRPDLALATMGESGVDGVEDIKNLPMWSKQVRVALRNCGNIDPMQIDQYIATGGYAALDKAVNNMTPEEVLKVN